MHAAPSAPVLRLVSALAVCVLVPAAGATTVAGQETSPEASLEVRVVTDEADAVLALLDKRGRGEALGAADWYALEATEGYRRLKARAESFGAEGFDESFRAWVAEVDLGSVDRLRAGVERWRSLDLTAPAARALAYLPAGTRLGASVYPVLKRTSNSFVFELDRDPAIFMYVSGRATEGELANTIAHELHHVGTFSGCPDREGALQGRAAEVAGWIVGFGEGMAMLAAAGGPAVHPHTGRDLREWIVWERDIARFNEDLERIEAFFLEILAGELDAEAQRVRFFELINTEDVPQGAFYTVGWKMAALVEQGLGRQAVIDAICHPPTLLSAYNEVARSAPRSDGGSLATWSEDLVQAVFPEGSGR